MLMAPPHTRDRDLLTRRSALLTLAVGATAVAAGTAFGDGYPSKPIRFIVPAPPAGGTDFLARLIGQKLTERFGQPVIVDNRPGANGNIGADMVAKAAPDGYTLLMTYVGTQAINPSLYRTMTYDPVKDFEAITQVVSYTYIVVVNPSVPARSLKELVELAKARPGELNFGSAGTGSGGHLVGELFSMIAGINLVHIPYKGSAPAVMDLIAGRIQVMFDAVNNVRPHVEAGKLRALALSGNRRSSIMPDVPTAEDAGYPQMKADGWYGVFAPAKTPREIVTRLNAEIVKIVQSPDVRERLQRSGFEPQTNTPEAFTAFLKAEITKWAQVVKVSGARFD